MKVLSILSMIVSLALIAAGYVVSGIRCQGSYSAPDDADGWGYFITAAGLFYLLFSIVALRASGAKKVDNGK